MTLLGSLAILSGSTAAAAAEAAPGNAEIVREAFTLGVGGPDSFYSILADDVQWTVIRADRSSTYTSRQEFLDVGAAPILDRLTGPIQAEVRELVTTENQVVALWRGTATARDGLPYVNEYAWVMTMANGRVTHVLAYLDLVALDELIQRVQLPA